MGARSLVMAILDAAMITRGTKAEAAAAAATAAPLADQQPGRVPYQVIATIALGASPPLLMGASMLHATLACTWAVAGAMLGYVLLRQLEGLSDASERRPTPLHRVALFPRLDPS